MGALAGERLAQRLVARIGREGVLHRLLDAGDVRQHDAAARVGAGVLGVERGSEDVRADVRGIDLRREAQELAELIDRDVRTNGGLQGGDELGQLRDERLRVGLLAERQEHTLLASAAVKIGRGMA